MSPGRLERRVLDAQMTGPDEPPVHVERHDLAIPEPGIYALPVGGRRRRGEVVFLMELGQRARGFDAKLPEPRTVGLAERLYEEPDLAAGRVRFRAPAANRMLALREYPVV